MKKKNLQISRKTKNKKIVKQNTRKWKKYKKYEKSKNPKKTKMKNKQKHKF